MHYTRERPFVNFVQLLCILVKHLDALRSLHSCARTIQLVVFTADVLFSIFITKFSSYERDTSLKNTKIHEIVTQAIQ